MSDVLSPDLVLILPATQRATVIAAMPPFEPWQPSSLDLYPHTQRTLGRLLLLASAYLVARFAMIIGVAALGILAAVAVTVGVVLAL